MADLLLAVGVDTQLSYTEFQSGITSMVSKINSNPPKIKVEFDIDNNAINKLQQQINAIHMATSKDGASNGAAHAARTAAEAIKQNTQAHVENSAQTTNNIAVVKSYYSTLNRLTTALRNNSAAQKSSNADSRDAYTAIASQIKPLRDLFEEYSRDPSKISTFREGISKANAVLTENIGIIQKNGDAHRALMERMGGLASKFSAWLTVSQVIMYGVQAVRKMVTSSIELDTAMTELKKVTDETDAVYTRFLENASSRASKLGASLTDVVQATADFARLGFNIEDASELADVATVYKNVGDGIQDISEASDSIIATMQAFGLEASDAMSIVDKFNAVGNNYAISSGGVGEALLRSAAAMKAANNTLDETIALATAANTVVQDPEKVGTTLKTVSMFLRASKTEAEEAGESTDGMASSVSELREEILQLTGQKVDIQIDENTFKSTYQILKELSGVWGNLTDVSQANILEMVGGKRNANVVAAILENFSVAENALETSMSAAGSALAENEKYLESVQGKIDIMQASFQTLSANLLSGDLLKFFIEFATSVLNVLNNITRLTNALGGFRTLLTAVVGIVATIKADALFDLVTKTLPDTIPKLMSPLKTLFGIFSRIPTVWKSFHSGTALAVQGTSRFSAALKGLGISASTVQITIGALAAVITIAIAAYSSYQQKLQETAQAELDNANAAKDSHDAFENAYIMASQYAEKTELSASESETLESAIKKVSDALEGQSGSFQTASSSAQTYLDKLKEMEKEQLEQNLSDANKGEKAARDLLSNATYSLFGGSKISTYLNEKKPKIDESYAKALEYVNQYLSEYLFKHTNFETAHTFTRIELNTDNLKVGSVEYADAVADYYFALKRAQDAMSNDDLAIESDLYDSITQIINDISSQTEEYIATKKEQLIAEYELQNGIPTTVEEYKAMQDAILGNVEYTEEYKDALADLMLDDFASKIDGLRESMTRSAEKATTVSDNYAKANAAITQSAEQASKTTTALISGISEAQNVINSQQTGKSISVDSFFSDELKNYRSALEYVNGTMQLNADKVREIAEAKAEEQVAINNTNKALEQTKYLENAKQIEAYRQKLRDAQYNEGETADSIQKSIDVLLDENDAIAATCDQYDLLSSSIMEAVGSYQHWLNAQDASDYGDMADDAVSAIQRIRDTYDQNSDIFGDYGSRKFDAAVEFIIPESVDSEDVAAIEKYMANFKQYLNFDDQGVVEGLDIDKFLKNAVDAGLMSYSKDDGFKVLGGKKMEDFAKGLNMSTGMVQAFFDELQLKGGKFDWADEADKTIGDLAISANVAAEKLRALNQDMAISIDVSDIKDAEEQSQVLDKTIKQMQDHKTTVGVNSDEIEYANSVITYCVLQKQQLENPSILNVDTSKVAEVSQSAADAIGLLQQFKTDYNNLQLQTELGVDTTEAQKKVDSLLQQIKSSDNDYIVNLKLDTTSASNLNKTLTGMSVDDIKAGFNIDDTMLKDYVAPPKEATVTYHRDSTEVDQYNPKNLERTVTYYIKYKIDNPLTAAASAIGGAVEKLIGGNSANGTAHIAGTARVGGDWGTAPGGKTLVGELGREIVVDPRTGLWYTVGETGAEFRNIPRGAIVFNHQQTEDLLRDGYISGRASALVSGTAMVAGGIKQHTASASSTTRKKSSSKSASSDKDNTKVIDWIKIAIDRIERAIDRLATVATSPFRTLGERIGATNDELSQMSYELSLQQSAYDRYIKQANSVGLSSDLAAKVRNGTIDINEYDSDTAELIDDYQEWYEKALDCKDAILDLSESIAELYKNKFDDVADDYENKLSLLEHLTNSYNNGIDDLEERGYLASTKYYEALRSVEQQNIDVRKQELADLTRQMSEAMNSGSIQEGSEAWYEFQQKINEVKEAIQESETAMVEFSNTIREIKWERFDYLQEQISNITEEADFLIDLMEHSDLYTDNGQLTDTGMATMGLHGQNYNVYMAQADKYAEELLKLNKEIANDPNNTKLLERREELLEAQRDAILAAEDEKDAIIDMVREGIELELSALQDLIDRYTETLDNAKNLYDYQKKIKEQTSEIASLQKQLSAYAGDNSEETRATVQKLQVDLSDAMENLEETQYDHYISEQKALLDNLYDEYEMILNERLDNVDALLSDMIDTINANSSSICDTLLTEADDVGYTITENEKAIWSNEGAAFSIITKYGESFLMQMTTVNDVISKIAIKIGAMVNESDQKASSTVSSATSTTKTDTSVKPKTSTSNNQPQQNTSKSKFNEDVKRGIATAIWAYGGSKTGWGNDPDRKKRLTAKFGAANAAAVQSYINAHANNGDLYRYWVSTGRSKLTQYYYSAFKKGGLADYTGMAWLDGTPKQPEMVLNPQDTENFIALKDAMRSIAAGDSPLASLFGGGEGAENILKQLAKIDSTIPARGTNIGDITYQVTIPIDHVQDYNDFMNQLRQDGRFEKMIQSMTVDRLVGGSKIAKNKYQW